MKYGDLKRWIAAGLTAVMMMSSMPVSMLAAEAETEDFVFDGETQIEDAGEGPQIEASQIEVSQIEVPQI